MKGKFFSFLLAFVLMFAFVPFLTGCGNNTYLAVVCTDKQYKATMSYNNKAENGEFTKYWTVLRKDVTVCGAEHTAIYIEYSFVDNDDNSNNYDRTLMCINGNVLSLVGSAWQSYTGSFGDKWSDIYGSMNQPSSFVYELTQPINGRNFPTKYKTATTDEYIEYDFKKYNEKFKISNDMYHICLYYNFEYGQTRNHQEATFVYGAPTDTIPHLDTITPEMIADQD